MTTLEGYGLTGRRIVQIAALLGTTVTPALADPPPPSAFNLPDVFCFRITDIQDVAGDPENDRFKFEFETLNWTNQPASGLSLAKTNLPKQPKIAGASIDPNGRPLGSGDDNANFPPADGTSTPAKTGRPNDWTVGAATDTSVRFDAGTALPNRDLLGAASTSNACALVPGCIDVNNTPIIANPETIDNAVDVGPFSDNVLDGFVFDIDDFDPGETLSLNWFQLDAAGNPIGVSGPGNAFGFGTFAIFRGTGDGPALFERKPGAPEGPGRNTGTTASLRNLFVSQSSNSGATFRAEFGAGLTAPFLNPADNRFNAPINAIRIVPAPNAASLFGIGLIWMVWAYWRRRSMATNVSGAG